MRPRLQPAFGDRKRRSACNCEERKNQPGKPVAFGREREADGSDERRNQPGKPVAFASR